MNRNWSVAEAVFEKLHADYRAGTPMTFYLDAAVSGTGVDPATGEKIAGKGSYATAMGGETWRVRGATYTAGKDPDKAVIRIESLDVPIKVVDLKAIDLERASVEFKDRMADRYHVARSASDDLEAEIKRRKAEFADELMQEQYRRDAEAAALYTEQERAAAEARALKDEAAEIQAQARASAYGNIYGNW